MGDVIRRSAKADSHTLNHVNGLCCQKPGRRTVAAAAKTTLRQRLCLKVAAWWRWLRDRVVPAGCTSIVGLQVAVDVGLLSVHAANRLVHKKQNKNCSVEKTENEFFGRNWNKVADS